MYTCQNATLLEITCHGLIISTKYKSQMQKLTSLFELYDMQNKKTYDREKVKI